MLIRLAKRIGPDSVFKLEGAATWRLVDAKTLEEAGRTVGAVYLYGYVAEARLQAACLRLLGYRQHTLVTTMQRKRIIAEAVQLRFMGSSPHNIAGWAKYLIYLRKKRLVGFAPDLRDAISYHAEAVYGHWRPSLRYRVTVPTAAELRAVREAAIWFETKHLLLWS